MTPRIFPALLTALLLLAPTVNADQTIRGLPLHIERPSENSVRLWVGDYISTTAVAALKTDKGIVVIDATESPTLDRRFREAIAKEFGRDDFTYLINTHEHSDHTTGNGVYSDCEIIAHDNCAAGMKARLETRQRSIDWRVDRGANLDAEVAAGDPESDEYKRAAEAAILNAIVLETLQSGLELTYPTRTFSESMELDMGNMTLELYFMGGTHTASDLFVFVPEEGLLFTGDMMADVWFTDTPGCLQSFALRPGMDRDVPGLLERWQTLIARKDEIKDYIPAHWNGDLTAEGFVDRYNYVEHLYAGIESAAGEGMNTADVLAGHDLQTCFPDLVGSPGFTSTRVHNGSVLALWSDRTGETSASTALEAAIEDVGIESALANVLAGHGKSGGKYYFLEAEFNALGYRYVQAERYEPAIAVFKANVEMNSGSWNSYDSLGEAYMLDGQTDLAIRNYETSMELNPENENGRSMLEEIRGASSTN